MNSFIIYIENLKKKIFYYPNNDSLLLILESNSINIEYQCRSGYCGTCRIQLIEGKIYYPKEKPIASMCNIKDIFPCYCQPKGHIKINI
ncbi:class I ribonucleotide reductase maintenance protein YfaE [Buchnera aphidicola]|uniref:class I ribonucleotide reductase maintenance protein YfaE n=1 Tax=Buchnera aphidicola TaxID=9 RepID=UPI003BEED3F1